MHLMYGVPERSGAPLSFQEPTMTNVSPGQQINNLKDAGYFREAGAAAFRFGHARSYGCHVGMRSTRDASAEAFLAGYDAAKVADAEAAAEAAFKAEYADLGISCGYIGGVHMWGDDRSFRVFTKLRQATIVGDARRESFSVPVFDVPYGHKGTWKAGVVFDTPAVRAQLDRLRERVASGELFLPTSAAR